ncbi:MAG TPA: DUF2911 domain-containing protein [Candidatus Sulfotelmatobacter sp.]|nr:DUF2911 domain-containing protein [Candidatus Sulfotelmatobacter sp.]
MRTLPLLLAGLLVLGAQSPAQDTLSTYCNFDDDNQVSIQYKAAVKEQPRNGRVWSPGITLFVQTPLMLGRSEIGLGAYSVHLIPDKKNWTIIVNRDVSPGTSYNPSQDVAKGEMEVGEIPEPTKNLQLSFAHMSPKECSLRVYYQKTGAFADFKEK